MEVVRALLELVEIVIAHSAKSDRILGERLNDGFCQEAWACSVVEVPWVEIGFEGSMLGYLVNSCGWFHQKHRSVDDCHALREVLARETATGSGCGDGPLNRPPIAVPRRSPQAQLGKVREASAVRACASNA